MSQKKIPRTKKDGAISWQEKREVNNKSRALMKNHQEKLKHGKYIKVLDKPLTYKFIPDE